MNWVDIVLLIAAAIGVACAGYLVARQPAFWFGMALVVYTALKPFLTKPLSPEDQKKLDASRRRAEEWDFARKQGRDSPK